MKKIENPGVQEVGEKTQYSAQHGLVFNESSHGSWYAAGWNHFSHFREWRGCELWVGKEAGDFFSPGNEG